ncbi:NusG domain II-containing protein [Mycoplasmatota bacterium]|nr:NusG domain II-containing protein [Mycoplasmatota bacterium]
MKKGDLIVIVAIAVISLVTFAFVFKDKLFESVDIKFDENSEVVLTEVYDSDDGYYVIVDEKKIYVEEYILVYFIDELGNKYLEDEIEVQFMKEELTTKEDLDTPYHIVDGKEYLLERFEKVYYLDNYNNHYAREEVIDYFVEVSYNGEIIERFHLADITNRVIELDYEGHNVLVVKDGHVDMVEADCPDLKCVHTSPKTYDSWFRKIICAPNGIVVSIVGGDQEIVDGIV